MFVTRRQCLALFGATALAAKENSLLAAWTKIARQTDGELGAAALHLTSGKAISLNGNHRFPLASVCKFPIAAHILAMVDEGRFALDQSVEIVPSDVTRSVSGVGERWSGQPRLPLNELLRVMVVQSDNTAVETLFRIGGGASVLAARFRNWRLKGMRIDRSEMQCNLDSGGITGYPSRSEWDDRTFDGLLAQAVDSSKRNRAFQTFLSDPRDTGTPDGTAAFLARAYRGELLSSSSTARLIEILQATVTGVGRLKGLLPSGTVVGHKTGTTGTVNGITGATNDSGVITLPEGKGLLAVSVYLKASTRDVAIRERVIAEIARAAYDAYLI